MAIRTDSLVPTGDMMGHEQLPPVPTPLEPPFSNILKRDLGKNFKDTVNNFTYISMLDASFYSPCKSGIYVDSKDIFSPKEYLVQKYFNQII